MNRPALRLYASEQLRGHDDEAFAIDPDTETTDQVGDAVDAIQRPDSDFVDWPWPCLNDLTGSMAPGDVWFPVAFSGGGKTTFVASAVAQWVNAGVKVYVLPLETKAHTFRTYMACQAVRINPGEVTSGAFRQWPDAMEWRKTLKAELHRQVIDPWRSTLRIKSVDSINLARLTLAAEEAADWGARILVVDHIDHITGDGKSLFNDSFAVNHGALKLAQKYGLVFLCTSQMNNGALAGTRDRLAQFGPPAPNHVYMGGHKRQIATGMIGLHRRMRDPKPSETPEEYSEAMKRAKDGTDDPQTMLAQGVMAVTAMKLRNFGQREGKRCFLGVEWGTVVDIPEKDQYATQRGSRGQV